MDNIQKFFSDIEKIKKHNRDANGHLDLVKSSNQIADLFQNNNRGFCDLPNSLTDYWKKRYVDFDINSGASEFSSITIEKIGAMQAFLDNDSDTDCLDQEDWRQIADAVNYEAEDMPMDLLSSMMSILVEKKAL